MADRSLGHGYTGNTNANANEAYSLGNLHDSFSSSWDDIYRYRLLLNTYLEEIDSISQTPNSDPIQGSNMTTNFMLFS